MIRVCFILIFFLVVAHLFSQDINRKILSTTDPYELYLNDDGSDTLFYYYMKPISTKGTILILLSGWFRKTDQVFLRTDLPKEAFNNGIATLIPSLNSRIHSDSVSFSFINKMILDYSQDNNLKINNIVIGGLSAGGIMALTYTAWMKKNPNDSFPSPCATFTVDSPVDLSNFWLIEQRAIERNCSKPTIDEAKYVLEDFQKNLGGTPDEVPQNYKKASPYSREDSVGGNAYYLKDIAVRAYCEPDIQFHLKRCEDYYDMNATDLSSMINKLNLLGNEKAELITTTDKGYRMEGIRHPHSWSILDSKECIAWIKRITE